jgi:outer membrane receptor protein involved in Fe transport
MACSILAFSRQAEGSIRGTVKDKATGLGLPSVNVVVKGTYHGAATDLDGNFLIQRVNPGSYVVSVSLIGYKAVEFTSIQVTAGEATQLNVQLEETSLSLGQEIVVIGERPLFNIEETSSRRFARSEELTAAAVKNISDVVTLQVGVVKSDDQIHIRGGRSYENAYLLDGVSVQDPLAGTGFGIELPPGAIAEVEVITGGYNAEFGQATSGVVNLTTKEGGEKFLGGATHKRDHIGINTDTRSNFNTDIYDGWMSGPEPVSSQLLPALGVRLPGKISLFGTLNVNYSDGYTRWVEQIAENGRPVGYTLKTPGGLNSSIFHGTQFAPRRSNNYSGFAKLTWAVTPTSKIAYSFSQSIAINQNTQTIQTTLERSEPQPGYQYLFQNIPDSANTFTQINEQHSLIWTQTLSSKTFYELRLSRYIAHVRGDANGKYWDEYREPKDIVTLPITYYNTNKDTVGVIPGDGFYDVGGPTVWRDHYVSEYTFKFDLTSYFDELNKFKTGVEMRFQDLQMVDILQPWVRPLGFNNDIYSVKSALGAIYAQDNITYKGMILNFGLRFDYWFPGKYVDDAVQNDDQSMVSPVIRDQYLKDTFTAFGLHWKGRLSPRLGISHPITDNQTLFFSYGHFSKFPRPQFVYSKLLRGNSRSTFQTIGNPNLNPETSVKYELGLRNQLSSNDVFSITAYYNDIFDYITSRSVRVTQTRFSAGSYITYINQDYARSRGVEVEYKTRHQNWFRGALSLSYSRATGKSSAANEAQFNIQQGLEENIKERVLDWDRPFQGSLVLNFTVAKNEPLFGFGNGVLDDLSIFTRLFYQSGRRYTPQILIGTESTTGRPIYQSDLNNLFGSVGSDIMTVDLNVEKNINFGSTKIVLSIEVRNLFNRNNVQIIDPVTGTAYEYETDGKATPTPNSWNDPHYPDLQAPVEPYPYNPARYSAPRNILVGLSVRF